MGTEINLNETPSLMSMVFGKNLTETISAQYDIIVKGTSRGAILVL